MNFVKEPWAHQLKAVKLALGVRDYAFLFEMGTGKTGACINVLRFRYGQHKRLMRTLVIAPLIVLKNWKKEFGIHSKIDPRDILVLNDTTSGKKYKRFMQACFDKDGIAVSKIVCINYEAFQSEKLALAFSSWAPEIIVADESHRLKNPKSVRARAIIKMADFAKHRFILTGTPILNSPMDIYNQYRFLDCGETFGKNFWTFRPQYFEDINAGWKGKPGHFSKWEVRPEKFRELTAKIYRKAMRVTVDECLDLPPLIKQTIPVPLSKEQAKLYKEMKNDYLTFIKSSRDGGSSEAVVAQIAVTKGLRLQQITTGFVKTENGNEVSIKENPRLEILEDLLGQLHKQHKVIIWASFIHNYRAIETVCSKLGIEFVKIVGGMRDEDRQESMEKFQTEDAVRVCIANRGAGGEGVNLTAASYSIVFSRNFSLKEEKQSEARNYRGGSEIHEKIIKIDLVAEGTIDELVLEALQNKQKVSDVILDWEL